MNSDILYSISEDRRAQSRKWGPQTRTPEQWLAIPMEEVGEVAKEIADGLDGEFNRVKYRDEVIQVAAVCVPMLECLRFGVAE